MKSNLKGHDFFFSLLSFLKYKMDFICTYKQCDIENKKIVKYNS